jgi:serine/threonine protein kinase
VDDPMQRRSPQQQTGEVPAARSPQRDRPSQEVSPTLVPSRRRAYLMGDTMVDMSAPTELRPGTVVASDFTIMRRIMRCDLGVLYEVTQRSTGQPCALKALDNAQRRDAGEREHFLREARIAEGLAGPYCPAVLGAGLDAEVDAHWIAFERLVGETLAERLSRLGVGVAMEPAEALDVIEQLCLGLTTVHDRGVVHRDLKPANVFLARAAPFTVKLLDFSAASAPDEPDRDDASLGTPLWMSPEQATGGAASPATDVWSVGLLAFRMLAGRSYWCCARNPVVEMRSFLDELVEWPLPPASERAAELGCERPLPDGFDAWFARCVARDPRRRFRNADEMAFALRDVRRDAEVAFLLQARAARMQTLPAAPVYREPSTRSSAPAVDPRPSQLPPAPVASQSLPPPPPETHERPVSFAFFDEEKTVAIPGRTRTSRWPLVMLGVALGVALVGGVLALVFDDDRAEVARGAVAPDDAALALEDPAAPDASLAPPTPVATRSTAPPTRAAPTAAPLAVVAPSELLPWPADARLVWNGRAAGDDGAWSFVLALHRDESANVRGYIAWTAIESPSAAAGEQVRESVEGVWHPESSTVDLRGVTSTAPGSLPVNAYRLRVRADGGLAGATIDDRETLTGSRAPASPASPASPAAHPAQRGAHPPRSTRR